MTDQPQQPDQQGDADAAYEAALAGEGGRDKYGLPARKVTTVGNESVDAAEQRVRGELAAIEKLKGEGSTEAPEQPTEAPEQQQPEQPAPDQPAEAPEGALAPEDVVNFLLGEPEGEELTPEQVVELETQRREQELLSGEASRVATESAAEYNQAIERLRADSPGITEPECIEAMTEPFERIAAAYGDEAAAQPEILRQLYQETGGEQRWGQVAQQNAEAEAYKRALGGERRDSFGFPIEE